MINSNLPDVQESKPNIQIPIAQVGVQNVEVPFRLESKYGGYHQLIANVSMRTSLGPTKKGISMSRLLLTLKNYLELPLKHILIKQILDDVTSNIGSHSAFMKFEFRFPIKKKSPITNNVFPLYYKCRFEGQMKEILLSDQSHSRIFKFFQGVIIQYSSYCPCSAELCNHLKENSKSGFPHAQRSYADILIETKEPNYVWLEDIIESVENVIRTRPYPIIKREDEMEVARIASENPIFVEDAIRLISNCLNEKIEIYDWIVKCTHEESIHTSEAIAINWKSIPDGFNGNYHI